MDSEFSLDEQTTEDTLNKLLTDLAEGLKSHYYVEKAEIAQQRILSNEFLDLTKRFHVLEKENEMVELYSEQLLHLKKFKMENDLYSYKVNIRRSNNKIEESLHIMLPHFDKLKKLSRQINWNASNLKLIGNSDLKSTRNYIDIVFDLNRDFRRRIIDRNFMQDMLNIRHSITVEVYHELLQQQDEFDDVFAKMVFLSQLVWEYENI